MNKNILTIFLVAIILLGGLYLLNLPKVDKGDQKAAVSEPRSLGASSGQNHSFPEFFDAGLVSGGKYATSTSGAALPLKVADIENVSVIDATLNIVDGSLTFPASTTMSSMMTKVGDTRSWIIRNASTTAAMDLDIASSTGVILSAPAGDIVTGSTSGYNFAKVTITRTATRDFIGSVELFLGL